MAKTQPPRVYRHPNLMYVAAGGVALSLAMLMGLYREVALQPGDSWWIWLTAWALAFYLSVFRIARSRVQLDDGGVEVRNPLSRQRYAWDEIGAFSLDRWGPVSRMGRLHPKDGPDLHIFAIFATSSRQAKECKHMIEILNEELFLRSRSYRD